MFGLASYYIILNPTMDLYKTAYSDELPRESEKMSQQNERINLFHLNKFFMIQIFFEQNHFSADWVAGPAQRDRVHKFCVTI